MRSRNNSLTKEKFLFPVFIYDDNLYIKISCAAGYIGWGDLYDKGKN